MMPFRYAAMLAAAAIFADVADVIITLPLCLVSLISLA